MALSMDENVAIETTKALDAIACVQRQCKVQQWSNDIKDDLLRALGLDITV